MALNINRVVAYGCSYTAGQELADAIILNKPHEEIDAYKRKHGIHCVEGVYGNEETRIRCTLLSSQLAWPNYIAERLGVSCSNRAKMGTSINEFIYNIERDIVSNEIVETDLIFVGLTCPVRFSWVSDSGIMITKFVGDSRWTHSAKLNDALLDTWATDCNLMWEYIKHAKYLDYLSKSLGNRLKIVMTVQSLQSIRLVLSGYKSKLPWLDNVKFDNLLSPEVSLSNFVVVEEIEKYTHGWGHPVVDVHKKFANHMFDELITTGVIDG
jgi:hypothetical protein